MQIGFNPASLNRTFDASQGITRIDIRPDSATASNQATGLFGADGPGFRDLLDAINPLNHLPIVSNLLQEATGHKVSAGAKLLGGALMGGPIGFVASLASVIFEDATGSDPAQAAYAALVGDDPASAGTQLASNAVVPTNNATDVSAPEAAPSTTLAAQAMAPPARSPSAPQQAQHASPASPAAQLAALTPDASAAILNLYGATASSAHASYQKAQLLPYLRDVTANKQV